MALKDLITSDTKDVFVNTDDFAEDCTYTQGPTANAIDITAIFHKVEYVVVDQEGFGTQATRTDCLIPLSDLGDVVPRTGDQIGRTVGTATHTYEVLPIDGRSAVASLDDSGNLWNVHTKRVA